MAVAWIGNREATVEQAVRRAADMLAKCRCPVFSIDGDVHGWRAAIALAERVGASYDQLDGAALARELALFTDKGAITVAPGEARRRADCVVIAGDIPAAHLPWVKALAASRPDLSENGRRGFFAIGCDLQEAVRLGEGGAAQTLAAVRARLAGRAASTPVGNLDAFLKALDNAAYTVFVYSGAGLDELAVEMLQGLVADLNRTKRAAMLLLPSNDDGWGGALASTWMTGFAPRTGFGRGMPEYDPWRFDAARQIASGEADLHLIVATSRGPLSLPRKVATIALASTGAPVVNAAVTLAVGTPGIDHDAVRYSSLTGTLAAQAAVKPSGLPSAASALRLIAEALPC